MKDILKNYFISIVVGLVLIGIGASSAIYFLRTKPEAQRRRAMSSMVPVVETMPLLVADQAIMVECLGTVVADVSARIQAQVAGQIVAVNPHLVEGELVEKGEVLVEIDDADYRIALGRAESNLLTAQTKFRMEEGQQDVVRQELVLMGGDESDIHRDLTLREPQLKAAQADVQSAELAVQGARLDLERTKIRAPFDAVVVSRNANIGDFAQSSKVLMELADINRFFIRASVPLKSLEPLHNLGVQQYPAEITLSDGSMRPAYTYKLLPDLTDKGRMARILLIVDNPYDSKPGRQLLLNEYVRVSIFGETAEGSSLIPRKYLRDGNVIWMIDRENKLRILPVELLQGYEDQVLIRAAHNPGYELVTTDLNAAVDGMEIRRVGDAAPQREPRQPGQGGRAGGGDGSGQGRGPGQGKKPGSGNGDTPPQRKPGA